jgi:hypothetical protein
VAAVTPVVQPRTAARSFLYYHGVMSPANDPVVTAPKMTESQTAIRVVLRWYLVVMLKATISSRSITAL